jgi:hypothetical protein
MSVKSWHTGQLLLAWVTPLLAWVAFAVYASARDDGWTDRIDGMYAVAEGQGRIAAMTSGGERLQAGTEMMKAYQTADDLTDQRNRERAVVRPALAALLVVGIVCLIVMTWRWFCARRQSLAEAS